MFRAYSLAILISLLVGCRSSTHSELSVSQRFELVQLTIDELDMIRLRQAEAARYEARITERLLSAPQIVDCRMRLYPMRSCMGPPTPDEPWRAVANLSLASPMEATAVSRLIRDAFAESGLLMDSDFPFFNANPNDDTSDLQVLIAGLSVVLEDSWVFTRPSASGPVPGGFKPVPGGFKPVPID